MEVLKSNSSAFFSVEASILVPFVYLQNHDVEKNITKKRFGKGIATLQATKISHQTGKRKKHRPKVSAFGCDGIRDRFQEDPGTSQRLVPKGNVTKAPATNLFFRPPSRIRNWLNWGARKKMMVVRGCRWLCVFLKISQVERMYNDRILQCLDCFFKCWESIKKTQLTVELLNCWKPTSLKWFVFSEKLRKLPGQLLIYKVMRATSPKANSCGC